MNDDDNDMRMVPIEDLQFKKRHEVLPAELIDRITLVHHAFRDYLRFTLEETIENFKSDEDPEREIRVWEHMASVVLTLRYHYQWPQDKVSSAVQIVLGLSMGTVGHNDLDAASTNEVIALWNRRGPQ